MKRSFVLLATTFAAVTSLAAANTAEAQRPFKVGIAAGLSLPTSDLNDLTKPGFNLGASLTMTAPALPFAVRLEGAWDQFDLDEDVTGGTSGNVRVLSFTANALLEVPSTTPVRPYLIGGMGLYNLDGSANVGAGTTVSGDSENKFGFNVGAGLRMPLAGLDTFLEARYHHVTDSGVRYIPITFGVRF